MQPQSNSILMALIAIGLGLAASQTLHSYTLSQINNAALFQPT